ncbi:hypothetical protein QAD02_024304 [Eretmocerus hayati]|uniref:Uncharacterized protein n=1 Tax=Eretmocerus hayati TaxID=131215 RepID=A0ACC2PY40_9HYME|nr:hypothetical protein QAD02_024304 [Eretmocerus hayati]
MDGLIVTPEVYASVVYQITYGLLQKRFEKGSKCYLKVDYNYYRDGDYFGVQITKCSAQHPDLKFLLLNALRELLRSRSPRKDTVVATIETRTMSGVQLQRVVCTRKSSLSLVVEETEPQSNEFASLKTYVTIKVLFQVQVEHFEEFSTLLLCYILHLEQIDPNIKFVIRRGEQYFYRNQVQMDDIFLSGKILSSCCAAIFHNSKNADFQQRVMNELEIGKKSIFEKTLSELVIAQSHHNFKVPRKKSSESQETVGDSQQLEAVSIQ